MNKSACVIAGAFGLVFFVFYHIGKQNSQIIATRIKNTVDVNFFVVCAIKADVVSTDNETIITFDRGNRGQRNADLSMCLQYTQASHDFTNGR